MDKIITFEQKQGWQETYIKNRYLANLSTSSLEIRLEEILLNLLDFSSKGEPFFDQTLKMSGLVERYIHVNEELKQRGIQNYPIRNPAKYLSKYPNVTKALKTWKNKDLPKGQYLVKFGKKEHLCQIKESDKIRINPASFYNDSSLNIAVQDDELSQTFQLPKDSIIKKQNNKGKYEKIEGAKNLSLTKKYATDYYVYCMGTTYQHRLFDDFNADATLLIYNTQTFLDNFLCSIKKEYPDWLLKSGNIKYYDPYFPKPPMDIPFNKHFSYWYQSEYRIAFKPENPIENLEYVDLEIGSLKNCTELILL